MTLTPLQQFAAEHAYDLLFALGAWFFWCAMVAAVLWWRTEKTGKGGRVG